MQMFIAEKGSVLLVEKLQALLVASNGCMGEKFEDLVAKICHYVISDIIKTGLSAVRRDVTRGMKVDGCRHRLVSYPTLSAGRHFIRRLPGSGKDCTQNRCTVLA